MRVDNNWDVALDCRNSDFYLRQLLCRGFFRLVVIF